MNLTISKIKVSKKELFILFFLIASIFTGKGQNFDAKFPVYKKFQFPIQITHITNIKKSGLKPLDNEVITELALRQEKNAFQEGYYFDTKDLYSIGSFDIDENFKAYLYAHKNESGGDWLDISIQIYNKINYKFEPNIKSLGRHEENKDRKIYIQSWLKDVDNDGIIDILQRALTYNRESKEYNQSNVIIFKFIKNQYYRFHLQGSGQQNFNRRYIISNIKDDRF